MAIRWLVTCICLAAGAGLAQPAVTAPTATPDELAALLRADLVVGLTIRADSLTFRSEPQIDVRFYTHPDAPMQVREVRLNLPVEPAAGVTYRNVVYGYLAWVELPQASGPTLSTPTPERRD